MKAVAAFPLILLAGCDRTGEQQAGRAPDAEAAPGFECAVDGASDYGGGCTVERAPALEGTILTLRSPTGSFRRLRVERGRIAAADGAEPARVLGEDAKRVEIAIGGDRYRLPRELLR